MKCVKLFVCILAFALLTGCAAGIPQEPTAPTTEVTTAPVQTSEPTQGTEALVTEPGDEIPWQRLTYLEIHMSSTAGGRLRAMAGEEVFEWSVTGDAFSDEIPSRLAECEALTDVICDLYKLSPEGQVAVLQALAAIPNLKLIALQQSTCDLAPLAECESVERFSLVRCDLSTLPATNITWLGVTDCTGMDWSRLTEQKNLETLGIYGTGMPETFEPVCAHPGLRTVFMDTEDPELLAGMEELPVKLTDPDGEIPEELGIPYTTEELREFLRRGDALIQIQIDPFA